MYSSRHQRPLLYLLCILDIHACPFIHCITREIGEVVVLVENVKMFRKGGFREERKVRFLVRQCGLKRQYVAVTMFYRYR